MITTAHDEPIIDIGPKCKPEAVLFYNEQRCGVDIFNKMCEILVASQKPMIGDFARLLFSSKNELSTKH